MCQLTAIFNLHLFNLQNASKCIRAKLNVSMLCQTFLDPPDIKPEDVTRDNLVCKVFYISHGKNEYVIPPHPEILQCKTDEGVGLYTIPDISVCSTSESSVQLLNSHSMVWKLDLWKWKWRDEGVEGEGLRKISQVVQP